MYNRLECIIQQLLDSTWAYKLLTAFVLKVLVRQTTEFRKLMSSNLKEFV